MKKIDKIIRVVENLGWNVIIEGNKFNLQKYSPAGQDFNIQITADNIEAFIDEIKNKYDSFDVSYETYLWLDDTGHGTNGSPYNMKDLYEDMEACLEMMEELYDALKEIL